MPIPTSFIRHLCCACNRRMDVIHIHQQRQQQKRKKEDKVDEDKRVGAREWSGLPGPALICIAGHLTNLVDFQSFSSVCKSWKLFTSDTIIRRKLLASLPPLVFWMKNTSFYDMVEHKTYYLHLHGLPPLPMEQVHFCGFSQGHFIFAEGSSYSGYQVFVLNPFTMAETSDFPIIPARENFRYKALLTSQPSSPNCVLVIFPDRYKAYARCCRRKDRSWILVPTKEVTMRNTCMSDGRLMVLASDGRLLAVDFSPQPTVTPLDVHALTRPSRVHWVYQLVDTGGGEVLAVIWHVYLSWKSYVVYRLDRRWGGWVKLESLGDRSLFIDHFKCYSVENPGRWGGLRADCIYCCSVERGLTIFGMKDGDVQLGEQPYTSHDRHPCIKNFWVLPSLYY